MTPRPGLDEGVIVRAAADLGTPEDIAEVVALIAGPGRWINGQTVYVNGGIA